MPASALLCPRSVAFKRHPQRPSSARSKTFFALTLDSGVPLDENVKKKFKNCSLNRSVSMASLQKKSCNSALAKNLVLISVLSRRSARKAHNFRQRLSSPLGRLLGSSEGAQHLLLLLSVLTRIMELVERSCREDFEVKTFRKI